MSIASLFQSFTGKGDSGQQQQQVNQNQNPNPAPQLGPDGQPVNPDPNAGLIPAPLDDAAKWFQPAATDTKPVEFDASKLIDQSPEAQANLAKAVGNLNFMDGVVTTEAMAKLEAGGPEAIQTTIAMMNKMAQGVFQAATQAAVRINETAIAKASPQIDSKVAAILKARDTTAAIKDASPALQHPAAQFMVDTLSEKLQSKYPTATSAQITEMAKKFVTDFSAVANPEPAKPAVPVGETDWNAFFEEPAAK